MARIKLGAISTQLIPLWQSLPTDALGLDPYNLAYLQRYLDQLHYNLYLAQHLVDSAALGQEPKTVIDLGGGIGFNTVYLRHCFPNSRIIHLDVDPESSRTARAIHAALQLQQIEYQVGELSSLENEIDPSTFICSRDVIEHIYDLSEFFSLSSRAMANAHNTAAILGSWFRSSEFKAIHHRAEFRGMESETKKARDNKAPYLNLRSAILQQHSPEKDADQIAALASASRGLILVDIQRFADTGVYPQPQASMLYDNTCDPLTGNWAERCIRPKDYRTLAGPISLQFHYPLYNSFQRSGLKGLALHVLNIFALLPIHRIQASFTLVY